MEITKIIEKNDNYSVYQGNDFLGEMTPSQLVLFYAVYRIKQADYDEKIKEIYSSALSIATKNIDKVIEELECKFEILLNRDVDFSNIKMEDALTRFDSLIYLGRIRSFTPTTITIGLTNRCFCQCKYCYAKECGATVSKSTGCHLEINVVDKIFKYANNCGITTISLTGGDPMAHPKFWDILSLCKKYNLRVNFSTKKILNDDDICNLLTYKEQIDYIQLSIDSLYMCEEEAMLDKSRCDKMLASLKDLIEKSKSQIAVTVNSVLTKYNIDNILDLSRQLVSLGSIKHTLSPYMFNLSTNNPDFFPTEEQYRILKNKIIHFPNRELLSYPIVIGEATKQDEAIVCQAGISALIINYDGNVYACERFCADKKFSIGSIYTQSLTEIWNGDAIKLFSNPDKSFFSGSRCGNCEHFDFCVKGRGICYVHSHIMNNASIYGPDTFCKYKDPASDIRIF